MHKFSKRKMLIFVACLLLGTALIGLGMAYVIQLKQRILPGNQNAVTRQSEIRPALCNLNPDRLCFRFVGEFRLA